MRRMVGVLSDGSRRARRRRRPLGEEEGLVGIEDAAVGVVGLGLEEEEAAVGSTAAAEAATEACHPA